MWRKSGLISIIEVGGYGGAGTVQTRGTAVEETEMAVAELISMWSCCWTQATKVTRRCSVLALELPEREGGER